MARRDGAADALAYRDPHHSPDQDVVCGCTRCRLRRSVRYRSYELKGQARRFRRSGDRACLLVTSNLKDFDFAALAALGVKVQSPDDFLADLFDANPALMEAVTREAAANLTRSTPSWEEYLTALAERHGLPKFVERLRSWRPKDVEGPAAPDGP